MRRFVSFFLMATLVLCLGFSMYTPVASADSDSTLRFGLDGKFKIVVFADCQDDENPYQKMITMIGDALDNEKPDLVVFTGDNVVVSDESDFEDGARAIIQPVTDRGIPFAYTFGNHDDEKGVSKEFMHSTFTSLGNCLTYDAEPSLNGFGNCNIPIYSSNGDNIVFNLWMMDSLAYADGGYDHVRSDQLEWYKQTSIALENEVGHKVNSIMFQHIAMPEIYNLLTESSSGSKTYMGKKYSLNLNSNASGYLGEFPCPPAVNGGQFDALLERGDVLGVVTGHDHSNGFHGKYKGIGFIQMPGMSFESYGDDNCRGYGVIEIDENNTSTYSTYIVPYTYAWNGAAAQNEWNNSGFFGGADTQYYVSSVSIARGSSASSAKNELTNNGFTVINTDLNADAGGDYIYLGYKTTTEPLKALRDLRFFVADSNDAWDSTQVTVNGKKCTYQRVSTIDLNKGAGGDYIYAYSTHDENAGPPIKAINFGTNPSSSMKVCSTLASPYRAAELNSGAGGAYIYCYLDCLDALDVSALRERNNYAKKVLENSICFEGSETVLNGAVTTADSLFADLEKDGVTAASQENVNTLVDDINRGLDSLLIQVKFVDFDGSVIETVYVPHGTSATCSVIPQRESDEQYHYTFSGWDTGTSQVTSSVVSMALYESEHYHSSEVPATCTENEVCRFCNEILNEATGHGETELLNEKSVSCETDGYTGDYCCVDCGQVLVAGESIPSTGHEWGEWVYYTVPTVTKNGTDRCTCSKCKTTIYRESPKATTATVDGEYIYGFECNLTTDEAKSYFNLKYLKVNNSAYDGRLMGTNSVISVTQKNVTTNYILVLFGDVNGDGWYDGQDSIIVSCLANGMLTREDVTEAEYMAADCNHDGVVDEADVSILNEAGLLLSKVDQTEPEISFESLLAFEDYSSLIDQSPETETHAAETPQPENEKDLFGYIFEIIKQLFELIISYVPVYLK